MDKWVTVQTASVWRLQNSSISTQNAALRTREHRCLVDCLQLPTEQTASVNEQHQTKECTGKRTHGKSAVLHTCSWCTIGIARIDLCWCYYVTQSCSSLVLHHLCIILLLQHPDLRLDHLMLLLCKTPNSNKVKKTNQSNQLRTNPQIKTRWARSVLLCQTCSYTHMWITNFLFSWLLKVLQT